jgi:formylglycine-generating enzyme required for sulfatase activity
LNQIVAELLHMRLLLLATALAGAAHAMPPQVQDCADCTPMALLPAGSFVMGADGGEPGRPDGPPHRVTIERPFALAITEVTNAQFARFAAATNLPEQKTCEVWPKDSAPPEASWRDPGLGRPPLPDEPVACVSWTEADAYARWLAAETGKPYRLPSEAEWEYAARAGTTTAFPWGDDANQGCDHANLYDQSASGRFRWPHATCNDGHPGPAPVGSYRPNAFGLHDMVGNVWEWVADCHVVPYPVGHDGAAPVITTPCDKRSVRGGSWMTRPDRNRVTFRGRDPESARYFMFGLRLARDLSPEEASLATP